MWASRPSATTASLPEVLESLLGARPDALHALLGTLAEVLHALLGTLAEVLHALLGALAETLHALLGALAHALDPLLGALAQALDALLGALAQALDALLGAPAEAGHPLPSAPADVSERALGALPGALHDVAGVAQQVVGAATDIAERLADALEQLGVAVQRGQHAREDPRHVVQASLEQRLRLDALDLELHLAEPDCGADVELDEAPGLGQHGEVRSQVIELELDLVDVDDRRVDVDVDRLFDLLRIDRREVRQLLVRPPCVRPLRG